jgi:hypothetical protein
LKELGVTEETVGDDGRTLCGKRAIVCGKAPAHTAMVNVNATVKKNFMFEL